MVEAKVINRIITLTRQREKVDTELETLKAAVRADAAGERAAYNGRHGAILISAPAPAGTTFDWTRFQKENPALAADLLATYNKPTAARKAAVRVVLAD